MRYLILLDAVAVWWLMLQLPCFVTGRGMDGQAWRRDQQTMRQQQQQQQQHDLRRQLQDSDELLLTRDPVPTVHAERIRRTLLEGLDKGSFPFELIWAENKSDEVNQTEIVRGLDVRMGINFHKIFDVDVTTSLADFVIWLRLGWRDPRLTWDPSAYGNTTEIFVDISEIWTPDIVLWNLESDISQTLINTPAKVNHDGTIYWTRPGRLRPVCKFQGLEDFPFDKLRCVMEFGSWVHSGKYLRPTFYDEGYTIGGSDTAGESYPEFNLTSVSVEKNIYPPFPISPSEDWPTLLYTVEFQRSVSPYVRGYVATQCLLNFVGFSAFWLPIACGERLALPITAILTAVTTELIVAARLPMANIMTWIGKFSLVSTLFAFAVVLESVMVTFFFYYTGDSLEPGCIKWMRRRLRKTDKSNSDPSDSEMSEHDGRDDTGNLSTSERDESTKPNAHVHFHLGRAVGGIGNIGVKRLSDSKDRQAAVGGKGNIGVERLSDSKDKRTSLVDRTRSKRLDRKSVHFRSMDAIDFKDEKEAGNNRKWQEVAANIDSVARLLLPSMYVVFIAILFEQQKI